MKYCFLIVLLIIAYSAYCSVSTDSIKNDTPPVMVAKTNQPQAANVYPVTTYQNPPGQQTLMPPTSASKTDNSSNQGTTPLNFLVIILLGAILGATGQGIRVIVGLKKLSDQTSANNQPVNSGFNQKQLFTSLLIALVIGAIAGILAAMKTTDFSHFSISDAMLLIGVGYAGTDFIEGFMTTNSISTSTGQGTEQSIGQGHRQ